MLSVFARSGKRTGSSNKPRRMNLERERFLALLRAGLWNKPTDLPSSDKPIHWANIMSMATRQTVIGLVANAIAQLPEAEKPDQQRIAQLQALLVRNHQAHQRLNRQLVETVSLLRENCLRSILLKGQGIAQLYSNPFLRQCGDIDLYIGPEDFEKARELIEQHYGKDRSNCTALPNDWPIRYTTIDSKPGPVIICTRPSQPASRSTVRKSRYLIRNSMFSISFIMLGIILSAAALVCDNSAIGACLFTRTVTR